MEKPVVYSLMLRKYGLSIAKPHIGNYNVLYIKYHNSINYYTMSSQVATQLASNNYRLFQIYILQGDQNWQGGTGFGCQNWSGRTDFGSKSGPGGPILAKFSVKIGPAGPILGGPILA